MRNAPAGFILECGKQGIVDGISDLNDRSTDEFAEALLIADLFGERNAADEDDLLP